MTDTVASRVLLDKTSPNGHSYVELFEDGRVKAGYYKDTAKLYGSADEALARFHESFAFSGNRSAWNILTALGDYMEQRDDGR